MISTITISLIAFLAIINYQGVTAVTRQREPGEIVPIKAEHSASLSGDDNKHGAHLAINLDFNDASSSVPDASGLAWLELTFDKVYCIKEVKLYDKPTKPDATWSCIDSLKSPDGQCAKCDDQTLKCIRTTMTVSTSSDAASSAASLPLNSDCKNGDIVRLASRYNRIVVQEIVVIGKAIVQCTLPATSENSQYEVAGVTQGDGTNVPVGTAFTLVCDEGYALENTKTSVQTCTEDLATSDISNECTRQDEHEKYSAGTQAWCNHVFVVITTLLSFYTA